MLKANGKYIDTMPVQQLFSQEEARADTIAIEVDRYYGAHDLAEFLFIMRGITPSGGETEAVLTKEIGEEVIRLSWEVGPKFTEEAGTLALDLFAYRYEEEADPEEDPPDYLLRYQLRRCRCARCRTARMCSMSRATRHFCLRCGQRPSRRSRTSAAPRAKCI